MSLIYNITQGENIYKISNPCVKYKETENFFDIYQNNDEDYFQYWMHQQNSYPESYIYDHSLYNKIKNAYMLNSAHTVNFVYLSDNGYSSSAFFQNGDSPSTSRYLDGWYVFSLVPYLYSVHFPSGTYTQVIGTGKKSLYSYITPTDNYLSSFSDICQSYSDSDIVISGSRGIGIESFSSGSQGAPNYSSYFQDLISWEGLSSHSIENPYIANGTTNTVTVSGTPNSTKQHKFSTYVGIKVSIIVRPKTTLTSSKRVYLQDIITIDMMKDWISKNLIFSKTYLNNSTIYSADYITDFTNFSPLLLESNTLYKTGNNKYAYYDDKNLLHNNISDLSDYIYFSQSEIDEIFNS